MKHYMVMFATPSGEQSKYLWAANLRHAEEQAEQVRSEDPELLFVKSIKERPESEGDHFVHR